VKFRLEYDPGRLGPPRWEYYGDYPSRVAAQQAERTLRKEYGTSSRTRITPVSDDAQEPAGARAAAATPPDAT
jgi:hypothetical protein